MIKYSIETIHKQAEYDQTGLNLDEFIWDELANAWNRHSGSFMVDMGILFSNMKYPSHEC